MNYYEVLEITPNASEEVIKAAYKALVKKYHPDNGNVNGTEKLQLINEAYKTLSDATLRKQYDKTLVHADEQPVYTKTEEAKERNVTEPKPKPPVRYSNSYESMEEDDNDTESGWGGVFHAFTRGVSRELQRNKQIKENAYYDGLNMDDFELVRSYKNNYGLKRSGYAQVLEERGFLERTEDGRFIPTEEFKYYWR